MQILAICGSPRGAKSQTKQLAEKALEAAHAQGAEVTLVDLSRAAIGFCRACELCHRGPNCALDDDGRAIIEAMLNADGILLASPVYLNQVTAQLKTILDRTSHFVHCLRLTGRYMAALTTSGGGGGAEVHSYLRSYCALVGAQFVGSLDERAPLRAEASAAAATLVEDLATAIREKRVYPDQTAILAANRARFAQLIAHRRESWPYEYDYWKQQGWL